MKQAFDVDRKTILEESTPSCEVSEVVETALHSSIFAGSVGLSGSYLFSPDFLHSYCRCCGYRVYWIGLHVT
jgi:hypothetical protein